MNARETSARQPLTDYISARWYRSPEQILRMNNYNNKIDVFALGILDKKGLKRIFGLRI
jgi:serine/threonine protein kinase